MAYLGVVAVCLLLPALVLKARTYFIVEGVLNFVFFPIDIASLYLNKQSTSVAFLSNIYHTDLHEAQELILTMWPLALVVIGLWIVYFVLAARVKNEYLLSPTLRKMVYICFPLLIVSGVLAMSIMLHKFHSERSFRTILSDAVGLTWMKLYKIYPYNLYLETYDIVRATYRQHQLNKQVDTFRFGIETHISDSSAMYLLVVGETARFDHFAINGYERNTNPCLSRCNNLISYTKAYSQANLTSYSVPLILTRASASDLDKAYRERSLPEAFQEAGFKAGFISKQTPSLLIDRIMSACDYSHSYNKGVDVVDNYDEEMIATLSQMNNDSLQFFVLHSLGCHFRYELRYPQSFALFQPTLGASFSYSLIAEENKDKLINAYDNAILYTDYFLSELIHYADSLNRPVVMLYMSEHGESFWDDEQKLSLHGSYQVAESEYHVPLIVWYSDEYAETHPEKVQAMIENKDTPVSSDVVFYSLLDAAGICDIVDSTRSICSPYLVSQDSILVITGSGSTEWMTTR
ncbi:MAG: phosphoethanolamine transferase [Paludibacteraceae bacterium]|nr:phosphoethanolamine transferase [Paludibacteraceae bacterium]